jgi:hypothetical protein
MGRNAIHPGLLRVCEDDSIDDKVVPFSSFHEFMLMAKFSLTGVQLGFLIPPTVPSQE